MRRWLDAQIDGLEYRLLRVWVGRSQAVRQRVLVPPHVGPNPTAPAMCEEAVSPRVLISINSRVQGLIVTGKVVLKPG